MPAFGTPTNNGARLQQDINTLAPLATQYHGALVGAPIQQYIAPTTSSGSGLSKFFHFLGGVGSEIGHVASGVAKWIIWPS